MPRLLKRWYVWLGLVLLLGLAASAGMILANPSRITQANFDRIQEGMSEQELIVMLGVPDPQYDGAHTAPGWPGANWSSGPNWITVSYAGGRVYGKSIHLATPWETLQWYAKKGAAKIGVKWD